LHNNDKREKHGRKNLTQISQITQIHTVGRRFYYTDFGRHTPPDYADLPSGLQMCNAHGVVAL
jgi:hypothetical protein